MAPSDLNSRSPDPPSRERYARQVLFPALGAAGQARLRASRLLVVGCGALGSRAAEDLARAGAGGLRLVDRDAVEWSNLHRQIGYEEADARAGALKAEALAAHLRRVNGEVAVEAYAVDFNSRNALQLAAGCDLLLDGTDNLPARFLINDVSYRLRVPWIYAGAVGEAAHVQFFSGGAGPCLRCQLPEMPPPGSLPTCDTAGVIGPAAALAAAWQAALALRYLVERDAAALAGRKAMFSAWEGEARFAAVAADPGCSVCAGGRFEALGGREAERATVLCGRKAVQVLPAAGAEAGLDLARLAARLRALGTVEERPRLLRFATAEGPVLTIFPDGRVIVDGLTEPAQALSLYARLIGQ